jgi:hypothetical protein
MEGADDSSLKLAMWYIVSMKYPVIIVVDAFEHVHCLHLRRKTS